jgi:hypothetical protein
MLFIIYRLFSLIVDKNVSIEDMLNNVDGGLGHGG